MKKILLLYIVFGIVLYSSANLYAQDNFEDCFNIERVKAKDEGANSREAIDLAEKICKIKFDETKQNSGDETKQNSGTVTDSTDNTISFSIDIFTGNKNIKDLDISLSTYGILLDFYITPNISFATSYFISTGEEKTTSTLSETISDNIQVPYYVDETYDTQTPYYVDETYDAQVFSHYEDETYDTQVRIVPSTNFYSNSSIHYQCVFFSFDDNNNSLTYEEWDCHREIYSVRIYPGLYCADFGYLYTVEVYVHHFCL